MPKNLGSSKTFIGSPLICTINFLEYHYHYRHCYHCHHHHYYHYHDYYHFNHHYHHYYHRDYGQYYHYYHHHYYLYHGHQQDVPFQPTHLFKELTEDSYQRKKLDFLMKKIL